MPDATAAGARGDVGLERRRMSPVAMIKPELSVSMNWTPE